MTNYIDFIDSNGNEWTRTNRFREAKETIAAQAAVIEKLLYHVHEAEVYTFYTKYDKALVEIRAALAIPTDSTQILDEVRRAEREKCAKVCDERSEHYHGCYMGDEATGASSCAGLIRAME